jgi:hypothetical protein
VLTASNVRTGLAAEWLHAGMRAVPGKFGRQGCVRSREMQHRGRNESIGSLMELARRDACGPGEGLARRDACDPGKCSTADGMNR